MTFIQRITSVISEFIQQSHILQQLLLSFIIHTGTLKDILVNIMRKFNVLGSFTGDRKLFLEFVQDLSQGIILGGTVDSFSQNLFSVKKNTFDKFASVLNCEMLMNDSYSIAV